MYERVIQRCTARIVRLLWGARGGSIVLSLRLRVRSQTSLTIQAYHVQYEQ